MQMKLRRLFPALAAALMLAAPVLAEPPFLQSYRDTLVADVLAACGQEAQAALTEQERGFASRFLGSKATQRAKIELVNWVRDLTASQQTTVALEQSHRLASTVTAAGDRPQKAFLACAYKRRLDHINVAEAECQRLKASPAPDFFFKQLLAAMRQRPEKRNALLPMIQQWHRNSSGVWEGDTLVVETRNHQATPEFSAIPLSAQGVVRERFTRVSDEEIAYEFRVDDPGTYRQVWNGGMPIRKSPKGVFEYACAIPIFDPPGGHEVRYPLPGIFREMRIP